MSISMSVREKRVFILIISLLFFTLFSGINTDALQDSSGQGSIASTGQDSTVSLGDTGFLVASVQDSDSDGLSTRCKQAVEKGILFLRGRQSPDMPQPENWVGDLHIGEYATYMWHCPDMRDKKYVFTLFTTPFVVHSLNTARDLPIGIVSTPEFEQMIHQAVIHLALHEENIDGHYGIYRFFGYNGVGEFAPPHLPADFCTTGCINAALHESGVAIRPDLDFFKNNYRAPNGVFYVWLFDPPVPTDICSSTVANALYMFASLGEECKIPEIMGWLNDMLEMMMTGLPYFAEYYRSPYAFTYLTTRVYADTGAKTLFDAKMVNNLQTFILSSQQEEGKWPPSYHDTKEVDLETALALLSLLNLGYDKLSPSQKSMVDTGVLYLLDNQNSEGSWDCAPFYIDPVHMLYFGSEELTTAFCIEALAKYAKVLK